MPTHTKLLLLQKERKERKEERKKRGGGKAIIQFIFPVLFAQNLFTMYTYMLHDGTMEKCTTDALPEKK